MGKIVKKDDIFSLALKLKKDGKAIVFTNGCFDILHAGHVSYLGLAAEQGDVLVVGLNSDKSVKRIKGSSRPITNEDDRAVVLAALGCVDYVVVFEEDDPGELIRKILPNVLVKGRDWQEKDIIGADVVKKNGGRVFRAPFSTGLSTTAIIEKIKKML